MLDVSPEPLRAATYARASDDSKRRDARSVDEQDAGNAAACRDNGWTPAGTYSDNDRSASRFATRPRPEWDRLLADLKRGMFDVIVLWTSARGDRTPDSWFPFLTACRERGILIHVTSHGETYDVRKHRQWKTLADDGVSNAVASEETSIQVRRTMASQALKGAVHGACPYGYRRTYDPDTGAVTGQVPHEETAPVAREIIRRIADGEAVSAVSIDLNKRDIPSPRGKAWSTFIVRRVATNPVYIAKRRWKHKPGELLDGKWEPLIDAETYGDAVAVLSARAGTGARGGRAVHLLSVIAVCGTCGATLVSRAGGTAGARRVYCCSARSGCVAIVADWLDEYVAAQAVKRLSQPDLYPRRTGPAVRDEAGAARAEAAALKRRHREACDLASKGKLSVLALSVMEETLLPQIEEANRRAERLAIPPPLRSLAGQPLEQIRGRWEALPVAARRDIIRALFTKVELVRATGPDRHSHKFNPERIRLTWRGEDEPR